MLSGAPERVHQIWAKPDAPIRSLQRAWLVRTLMECAAAIMVLISSPVEMRAEPVAAARLHA
jgi:hypothetical protein